LREPKIEDGSTSNFDPENRTGKFLWDLTTIRAYRGYSMEDIIEKRWDVYKLIIIPFPKHQIPPPMVPICANPLFAQWFLLILEGRD